MNVALRTRITKEEFLEWEGRQELRYEFDGRRPIAMVGGTQAHELIITNILFHLKLRLRGGPYQVFGNGMKIEAARLLVYRAAWLRDNGLPFSKEASIAKLYASEISVQVSEESVQLHGGYGYIKEYPAEKYWRDSKLLTIGEGTSDALIEEETG